MLYYETSNKNVPEIEAKGWSIRTLSSRSRLALRLPGVTWTDSGEEVEKSDSDRDDLGWNSSSSDIGGNLGRAMFGGGPIAAMEALWASRSRSPNGLERARLKSLDTGMVTIESFLLILTVGEFIEDKEVSEEAREDAEVGIGGEEDEEEEGYRRCCWEGISVTTLFSSLGREEFKAILVRLAWASDEGKWNWAEFCLRCCNFSGLVTTGCPTDGCEVLIAMGKVSVELTLT